MKKSILFLILFFLALVLLPLEFTKAADNASGYLIKGSGATVYFYSNSNQKRYVFPDAKTYATWYENYNDIQTISDYALSQIPLGGNVVFRPGTRLVKITTDPKVYVVGHNGYLHWLSSETLAKKLYGNNWSKLVADVPDAFFTNYKFGDDLNTATYVDGTVIRYAGDTNMYLIKNGKKHLYSMAMYHQDHFNMNFVKDAPSDVIFADGPAMTYGDLHYGDVAQINAYSSGRVNHINNNDNDIDECALNTDACSQNCVNTVGSYTCGCYSGYTLNADGRTCDDINECSLNTDTCSQNCVNILGSYTCSCNSGYTLNADGRSCDSNNDDLPITAIPNVEILEFATDDPCRASNGNVNGACVVERFYENNANNYDVLITINLGSYNGLYNDWSDFNLRRYMPYNIGMTPRSYFENHPEVPSRLRYMQHVETSWKHDNNIVFVHELGHTWTVGWVGSDVGWTEDDLNCYEAPWIQYAFENGHWSELFQGSDDGSSVMAGIYNLASEGELSGLNFGIVIDNHDGTFTWQLNNAARLRFNYIDLYAMGLMSESELAQKEMFTLMNPVRIGTTDNYFGTRQSLTLNDFKNLLKKKELCDGEGLDYFTGDGSRRVHEYDQGRELAENFNVAIVLIKHPDQKITADDAYRICRKVNYDWVSSWNYATYGRSNISTNLGDTINPDCSVFFQ